MSEQIFFAKVKPDAIIPSKLEEDAGYDVYANFKEEDIIIGPHTTKMIPTGIASACSPDFYFQLQERGSTGTKGIAQRCGVIDSGYRKEWFVPLTNTTHKTLWIDKNVDKIEEDVLLPVPKTEVIEMNYEDLKNIASSRGMNCLGSSNK